MSAQQCGVCQSTKTGYQCGICNEVLCKNCVQFIDAADFSFLPQLSSHLACQVCCQQCYAQHVEPEIEQYNQTMEKAKNVQVFFKTQTKETRFIKRTEKPVHVKDCQDHDETILRLAFLAALAGFNGLVDATVTSEKVRTQGYQTTVWRGTAVPAMVKQEFIVRDRSIWQNPN